MKFADLRHNWPGLGLLLAVCAPYLVLIIAIGWLALRATRERGPLPFGSDTEWLEDWGETDELGRPENGITQLVEIDKNGRYSLYRLARYRNGYQIKESKSWLIVEIRSGWGLMRGGSQLVVVPED